MDAVRIEFGICYSKAWKQPHRKAPDGKLLRGQKEIAHSMTIVATTNRKL